MKSRSLLRPLAFAVGCVALLAGCSSGGDTKVSTATSTAPAQAQAAFARLDPAAFAERMNDHGATVINVHIPY